MKITGLETVQLGEFPNLLWLRIHTDQGLVGLGETFYAASTVASYVHEVLADKLLGADALRIGNPIADFAAKLGENDLGAP